jgi:hypothetical protein
MHHSAVRASTRCLRRSVRPCGALGLPGRPCRCGDLGLHGPPGSDATMMQLIPLHGPHHHCACWHHDASRSSRMHRVHPAPDPASGARPAPQLRGTRRTSASLVAPRVPPANQQLSLHLMHPCTGDGCSRSCQPARQPRGTPPGRPTAGRGRHASQSPTGRPSWPGPATWLGRSAPVTTNLGNSLQAPRSG